MDVTGVSSAGFSHRSTIPDVVAALWDLRRRTRQAWHCSRYYSAYTDRPDPPPAGEGVRRRHVSFREGRSAHTDGVRDLHVSPGPPSVHARTPTRGSGAVARYHYRWCMQDPSPQGPLNATTPYIEDHAPATTTPPAGAGRTTGAMFARPRMISRTTATHAAFPQCTSYSVRPLYPRDSGEYDDFHAPTHVHRPSLTIKGGGGLPLEGLVFSDSKDAQTPPDVIHHHLRSGIPTRHVQPLF